LSKEASKSAEALSSFNALELTAVAGVYQIRAEASRAETRSFAALIDSNRAVSGIGSKTASEE